MTTPPHILVLFDVDGTLVDCGKTAGLSFAGAFEKVFGVSCPIFSPGEVAGLTDYAILEKVIRRLRLNCEDFHQRRNIVFDLYARNLVAELKKKPARELPGAKRAVRAVRNLPGCAAGLLTGSTERTAKIKLKSAGIGWDRFICGAYSEDGEFRASLPPVAQNRFAKIFGRKPKSTILVGDTPRDLEAALATDCLFIGVATGHYNRASLQEAGARVILRDFSETVLLCQAIREACRS